MNSEILIIIPAYNPPIELFEALLAKLDGAFKNVLIVNDGSDEEYNKFFKKLEKKLKSFTKNPATVRLSWTARNKRASG